MQTLGLAESQKRTGCGGSSHEGREHCCCSRGCACEETAPVLVLALGNPLMADDGVGQEILAAMESAGLGWGSRVEFVDGGTQGLALLGKFEGRKAVVFLDAVRLEHKAGAVHVLRGEELLRMGRRMTTAHEGSAPDILKALTLLGDTPAEVVLVGVEPEVVKTGIGLSAIVKQSVPLAVQAAADAVSHSLTAMAS